MIKSSTLCECFLDHLITQEVIAPDEAVTVLDERRKQTPPIGRIALLLGYLSMKQVFEVLNAQQESGLRFGEQAMALNFLNQSQLTELLAEQEDRKPSVGGILYELGYAKKGALQKSRRDFLRSLESHLT